MHAHPHIISCLAEPGPGSLPSPPPTAGILLQGSRQQVSLPRSLLISGDAAHAAWRALACQSLPRLSLSPLLKPPAHNARRYPAQAGGVPHGPLAWEG